MKVFKRININAAPIITPHRFTIDNQDFIMTNRGDGYMQITAIHPHNEKYHWAKGKDKTWKIYYKGKQEFSTNDWDYMKVAKKIFELDKAKGLTRTGGKY